MKVIRAAKKGEEKKKKLQAREGNWSFLAL